MDADDVTVLYAEILGMLFPRIFGKTKEETRFSEEAACREQEIPIREGGLLVVKLHADRIQELFKALRWADPPIVHLDHCEKEPARLRFLSFVTYRKKFLPFLRRKLRILRRYQIIIMGEYFSSEGLVSLYPARIWEAVHLESLVESVYHCREELLWTFAHELGHAWCHAKRHWSHEEPLFFRIIFDISRFYESLLSRWWGWLFALSGFALSLFFPGHEWNMVRDYACIWLGIAAAIGADHLFLIAREVNADRFADELLSEHGELLEKCLTVRRERNCAAAESNP